MADIGGMKQELTTINWVERLIDKTMDEQWEVFKKVHGIQDLYILLKGKGSTCVIKQLWSTRKVRDSIKLKERAYSKDKNSKDPVDWERYKEQQWDTKKMVSKTVKSIGNSTTKIKAVYTMNKVKAHRICGVLTTNSYLSNSLTHSVLLEMSFADMFSDTRDTSGYSNGTFYVSSLTAPIYNVTPKVEAVTDYDDEFLQYIWREYLYPKQYEWVFIIGYIIIFVVALVGNILVCFAVWKNHHMQTVTNYFIVNLSLADLLVTAICLPASLVVDITESWFFGQTLCKVIPYLQTVSVSVSVLTLSFIALDRWYAICHPLMFKSTAKRARNSIIVIWIISFVIMIPQAIVMEYSSMIPELANKTLLFSVCDERWGDDIYPKVYHVCFCIVTYMAPLCLMFLAYFQIFRKLWCRQIPGTSSATLACKWKPHSAHCSTHSQEGTAQRTNAFAAEIKQMRARRKTARMLMVVLLVFALCYLPISILNILKRVFGMFENSNDRDAIYAWFTFSHWLVYANSAANPIIYNFLSGKFREEFKASFSCCFLGAQSCKKFKVRTSARSQKSITTNTSKFDTVSRVSENLVLTSITTVLS
ncbi:orexin receptor type 2-like [Heptranchias perlo]|uniref:orexin receptor type 2-like n=1 Tax=Heptranchias perlo TaxID=212740 RepID=UPI003559AF3D